MTPFRDAPIQRKLTLLMAATSAVVVLLGAAVYFAYDFVTFRRKLVDDQRGLAETIAASTLSSILFNDRVATETVLGGLRAQPQMVAAFVLDEEGRPFASYVRRDAARQVHAPALRAGGAEFAGDRLKLYQTIEFASRRVGMLYLESDLRQLRARVRNFALFLSALLLASAGVGFFLSTRLQKLVSEPILTLERLGRRVSEAGDYSVRVAPRGDDEIGRLMRGFNEMLERIQERDGELLVARERAEERSRQLQHEITERLQAEAKILHQAHHDALTGLPNRLLFRDRIEVAIAGAQRGGTRLAILFVDLDRFKLINDSLGHQAGDDFLRAVAARLGAVTRRIDTVARLAGDEFALLLPQAGSDEEIAAVAERALDAVRELAASFGRELPVSASAGIAVFPRDGEDGRTLLRNADIAMYRAKELGRNNVQFFTAQLSVRLEERIQLEEDLRRALARAEFEVFYQPRVSVADHRAHRVEALARWRHPVRGLVAPDDFLPLAADLGLAAEIDELVLRSSLSQLARWRRARPSLALAVNVSAWPLQRDEPGAWMAALLAAHGVPGSKLEIEVTEHSAAEDGERTATALAAWRRLGVGVALDDFGVGYSSLALLRSYPLTALKIDRSFVAGFENDRGSRAIVAAILTLAKSLGLDVAAEGVERPGQAELLTEMGCHELQGHLFDPPLPAADLEARWLTER
jgi:diguanylate cyclase (GGDEF)-like protein